MQVQWFPGHMAKARREVEQNLKLVDFVIELLDARAPLSSENPMLHQIVQNKDKMIVLMKRDLADPKMTAAWLTYYKERNIPAVAVDANNRDDIKQVVQLAKQLGKKKIDQLVAKGMKPRPHRAMILGIPNVGKSTLINRLASRKAAKTGDRPGITKQQLWIKIKKDFELLDTPGILWPKFEDQIVGYRLASIGTIKDQVISLQDITVFVIEFLQRKYPDLLFDRYEIEADLDDMLEVFERIGKKRGALESGGEVDFDKVSEIVLRDLRSGRLGKISLEAPADLLGAE
ncbi:ribosome biogenesis GTPase YlqF [Oceanobacillus alkalisoli]|uniref:ribosome biogenesis GTPase YlqF n=1 Tax=Oceanobacillus alkalisoli TaxID=2925113 RepID=UPI001EF02074|nr:ribosome biogenesis GTPase YlqF [Oceanobacillus alkalisoli]MCF3942451.1 ribosome biogenesis GTPase YlqF [Oceanobacillus alkalisoli]MCG5103508.1 ribosome biogenesis GTPase YlqF [Oceanobacillus alkalisoli]